MFALRGSGTAPPQAQVTKRGVFAMNDIYVGTSSKATGAHWLPNWWLVPVNLILVIEKETHSPDLIFKRLTKKNGPATVAPDL